MATMSETDQRFDEAVDAAVGIAAQTNPTDRELARALVYSNVAIAHGLKLVSDAIDLNVDTQGLEDGVKQMAVELGSFTTGMADIAQAIQQHANK